MNIEEEVRKMVRRAIMEEVNGLCTRAAIRQEIEASGITKGKVNEMVRDAVDSYVRSVNVSKIAEEYIEALVKQTVRETVNKYLNGGLYSYSNKPKELLEEKIKKELFDEWHNKYSLSVKVEPKEKEE